MSFLSRQLTVFLVFGLALAMLAACQPVVPEGAAPADAGAPPAQSAAPALDPVVAAQIAAALGVDAASISVVSVEAVDWPDASLGCPQPDMMYAQVVTPGYRIVVEANGQQSAAHTDLQQPPQVVICTP